MAALKWDKSGEHFYETGISKGVLYPRTGTGSSATWGIGVAWNGLISVTETPEGADEEAFYADNIKYLALRGVEDFGGSITAYQSPVEFDACDGTADLMVGAGGTRTGITIGQQTRVPFCMAYTTQKGNDLEGNDYGEIIHIIYNATASPSEREYQTINDSPEPQELSWDFTTTPVPVTGYKNTAILKIDSTGPLFADATGRAKLKKIKDALFGTDGDGTEGSKGTDPHVLLPDEVLALISGN